MKKIGVMVPSYSIEYGLELLNGIQNFFSDKDVKVIITQTKFPHSTVGAFDYQYWEGAKLLQAEDVDVIILATGIYLSDPTGRNFLKELQKFTDKPIVSPGVFVDLPNVYSVTADCKKVYYDVVEHLKNKHKCSKIAFFSANKTCSPEALERFESFKQALQDNSLEFNEDLVFDGGFTNFGAVKDLSEKIKSKKDIKFDSIVCANDSMADGTIQYLSKLGVEIGKDVLVFGFDDTVVAQMSKPTISTISQRIDTLGYTAAQIAYKIINGENVKKHTKSKLDIKYRQSCGCVSKENLYPIYINEAGEEKKEEAKNNSEMFLFENIIREKNNIITLMDMLKGSNTLRQFYYNFRFVVAQCDMSNMGISLYDSALDFDSSDDFEVPEHAEFYLFYDTKTNTNLFRPGVFFNPRKTLFPSRSCGKESGIYMLQPIFSGEQSYGFLTCKINGTKFLDYNVYLKIIINSISQAYEYTSKIIEAEELEEKNSKLIRMNTNLSKQSRTDELTNVFNRRGFLELGQRSIDVLQEVDTSGVVIFADMDGLKVINDTYGHDMGDKAIKLQAYVLKNAFRKSDIIGRLGGDEFGVVAAGMRLQDIEKMKLKIELLNQKVSKDNDLPFVISISLGAVDLQESSSLKKLLASADKFLYEEKSIKKNKFKNKASK